MCLLTGVAFEHAKSKSIVIPLIAFDIEICNRRNFVDIIVSSTKLVILRLRKIHKFCIKLMIRSGLIAVAEVVCLFSSKPDSLGVFNTVICNVCVIDHCTAGSNAIIANHSKAVSLSICGLRTVSGAGTCHDEDTFNKIKLPGVRVAGLADRLGSTGKLIVTIVTILYNIMCTIYGTSRLNTVFFNSVNHAYRTMLGIYLFSGNLSTAILAVLNALIRIALGISMTLNVFLHSRKRSMSGSGDGLVIKSFTAIRTNLATGTICSTGCFLKCKPRAVFCVLNGRLYKLSVNQKADNKHNNKQYYL